MSRISQASTNLGKSNGCGNCCHTASTNLTISAGLPLTYLFNDKGVARDIVYKRDTSQPDFYKIQNVPCLLPVGTGEVQCGST